MARRHLKHLRHLRRWPLGKEAKGKAFILILEESRWWKDDLKDEDFKDVDSTEVAKTQVAKRDKSFA